LFFLAKLPTRDSLMCAQFPRAPRALARSRSAECVNDCSAAESCFGLWKGLAMLMRSRSMVLPGLFVVFCACSAPPTTGQDLSGGEHSVENAGSTASPIVNGTKASAYEEAALVDMYQQGQLFAACSASVIAPKVVLTAGHCVDGVDSWKVTTPYAGGQKANASSGATYDWHENGAETVNPNHHDIGLIFLDTAIKLTSYPALAQKPVKDGTNIVNIGRILNGTLSSSNLYVSSSISVSDGAQDGFPFDYSANEVIESGDSGGPDELPGQTPHLIVAVNSGAGQGSEVLARVDLLYTWIQQQIQSHGGNGNTGGNDAGTTTPDAGGTDDDAGSTSGGHDAGSSSGDDAGTSPTGGHDGGGKAADAGKGSGGNNDNGGTGDAPVGQAGGCATAPSRGGNASVFALGVGLALAAAARRRRRVA
jgi:hypothetical protein